MVLASVVYICVCWLIDEYFDWDVWPMAIGLCLMPGVIMAYVVVEVFLRTKVWFKYSIRSQR